MPFRSRLPHNSQHSTSIIQRVLCYVHMYTCKVQWIELGPDDVFLLERCPVGGVPLLEIPLYLSSLSLSSLLSLRPPSEARPGGGRGAGGQYAGTYPPGGPPRGL